MLRNASRLFFLTQRRDYTKHEKGSHGLLRETKILEAELYEAREIIKQLEQLTKENGIIVLDPSLSEQIDQHLKKHGDTKPAISTVAEKVGSEIAKLNKEEELLFDVRLASKQDL